MTADLYTSARAAIEARRELVESGRDNLAEDVVDLDPTLRRAIEQEGTCDGCAETKALVVAVDLPDAEPWLCSGCAAYDSLIVAMHTDYPRHLDAFGDVLARHWPDGSAPFWCMADHGESGEDWPCPDAQSALTALAVTS